MIGSTYTRLADFGTTATRPLLEWSLAQGDLSGFGLRADPIANRLVHDVLWAGEYRCQWSINAMVLEFRRDRDVSGLLESYLRGCDHDAGTARREVLRKHPNGLELDLSPDGPSYRPHRAILECLPMARIMVEWTLVRLDISEAHFRVGGSSVRVCWGYPGKDVCEETSVLFPISDHRGDLAAFRAELDNRADRARPPWPRSIPPAERFGDAPRGS